jgi:hypothetical protein
MKKVVLALFLSGVAVFGCYDSTSQFTRVMLFVGQPAATVDTLHIAVFAIAPTPETVIMKTSVPASSLVPLVIPSTGIMYITVWGVYTGRGGPYATHYGASVPIILNGQDFTAIPMEMIEFKNAFNEIYNTTTYDERWNYIYGATSYELRINGTTGTYYYPGGNNFYNYGRSWIRVDHEARCLTSIFGVPSEWSVITNPM